MTTLSATTAPHVRASSVAVLTTSESTEKAAKQSAWRKIKSHLHLHRRASRQVDDKSALEKKRQSKEKRVSFIRAFLDAACPPLPTPAPPGPETFVRMPLAYRQKDHPGVVVAGRRVPFSIHMHIGRRDSVDTLETVSEDC